ncbi:MAG: transglycosylase [Desulfuromonadales bacterium GWC2_61_20]|nr:MAG: transglycosylase [Desulfuromonadales bacterium GWC2_61_20]
MSISNCRRPLGRLVLVLLLFLAGCVTPAPPPPVVTAPPPAPPPAAKVSALTPVAWAAVEGWSEDDPVAALEAFRGSCRVLRQRPGWESVCSEVATLDIADGPAVKTFFETRFVPHQVRNPDGNERGVVTGYYVPDLIGSRERSERFAWPLYAVPDDLLIIDLRSVYPELADYRLRGRLDGRRVVPYWSRADIDAGKAPPEDKVLFWVDDPVELFFLHIQGSGRIVLKENERVMVHYADQNGHPFRSIGKLLLDRGEMTRDQMSMQNIKAWGQRNPERIRSLLAENPSYIFFNELAGNPESPTGALGVTLTPGRSIAVDPRSIPLGAPVFLATTWPTSPEPLRRLMVAQDTGGAIKGAVRADFFWGMGKEAGDLAGRMKQALRLWVLLPVGMTPPGGA